jgi:beta-lactamase class A
VAVSGASSEHHAMQWLAGLILITALAAGSRTATAAEAASPVALAAKLATVAERAGGRVGVSVIHVESGQELGVGGSVALPLYSVFKLPLAAVVLKSVERGQLSLDQKATVEARDVAPGVPGNAAKWRTLPIAVSVRQLLEFSLVDSDNTASDKLLSLIGGPVELTRRIRALGLSEIEIRTSAKEATGAPDHPNRGSAAGLARLLAALQRGVVLRPTELAVLWDFMGRSQTGQHRLRGALPAGTPVVSKTGSGRAGSATNDVGVVTLPGRRGHLAIAVLMAGSGLSASEQERLIAEMARAAFDAYATPQ